jgi:hypothetical protein
VECLGQEVLPVQLQHQERRLHHALEKHPP